MKKRFAIFFASVSLIAILAFHNLPNTHAEDAKGQKVFIKNSEFFCTDKDGDVTVKDWLFLERVAGCSMFKPEQGKGVILLSSSFSARADLLSHPIEMKPFQKYEVTVEYETVLGNPLLFVCLRPNQNRRNVDLDFLPMIKIGKENKASVIVHTGAFEGVYSFSVSITGNGLAKIKSIEAESIGEYICPKKPAFVIDIMHAKPPEDGKFGWDNIHKLADVFGIPKVEFLHYSQVTEAALKEIDPCIGILSPASSGQKGYSRSKVDEAIRILEKSGIPMVGICLGHQWYARYMGSRVVDGKEWGPHKIKIVELDPIFKDLPRYPFFVESQSHNYMVDKCPSKAEVIATTDAIPNHFFRYKHVKCYTSQGHFERGWEDSTPAGCVIWKNILREYKIIKE